MAAWPLFDSFLLNTQASLCPRRLQMACTQLCAGPLQSTSARWLWSCWIGATQYPEAKGTKLPAVGCCTNPLQSIRTQQSLVYSAICIGLAACAHMLRSHVSSIHLCLKLFQFHLFWMIGLDTQVVFAIMCLKQLQFHVGNDRNWNTCDHLILCVLKVVWIQSHSELNNNRQKKK